MTSSTSQLVNEHTSKLLDGEEARASCNQGEQQKAVAAKEKRESFSREENCCVSKTAGKLAEGENHEAACSQQRKRTADGRKSHIPPQCDNSQEPSGGSPKRCELHGESALPPTGYAYRRGRPMATEQSRTQRQNKRCSSLAGTKTRMMSNHPYERSHRVKK